MKTAFLDAFSGLSGDMMVGALLDAGAKFAELERTIGMLGLEGYRISIRTKEASGIVASKFDVEVTMPQPERHLSEIVTMIKRGALPPNVTDKAITIFEVLAEAEARVHRTTPEKVHFHEVGAVDSIIDVVGTAWGLEQLGIERLLVAPLPMGQGFARSQHGIIPVPPPATVELLNGFPIRLGDGEAEMVTPTGAAIVRALGKAAPQVTHFTVERVAYGAGSKDFSDRPNVLRILIGREPEHYATDEMLEIATNIDDLNPQIYDHVTERLFAAGARDVTITPVIMKKGRPGVTLTVLAEVAARDPIVRVLFAETSTIGVRFRTVNRLKLQRQTITVATRYGVIRVKLSRDSSGLQTLGPEYDDCREAALAHKVPLKLVMEETRAAAQQTLG